MSEGERERKSDGGSEPQSERERNTEQTREKGRSENDGDLYDGAHRRKGRVDR